MNKLKLSKKNVTKLLNPEFRKHVLSTVPAAWIKKTKADAYAYYVTDSQIVSRDKSLANDKKSCYGFSPLNVLCAVKSDGVVETHLMEFNIVNHFLVKKDGDSAAEVVLCMLVLWLAEDKLKTIRDFDIDTIDKALYKLEQDFLRTESAKTSAIKDGDQHGQVEKQNCD